ncbi:hypothetical protein [Sedimentitalea todarodis]|uniref:Uncharacterized protein n=1 Tax=Sedimentitalea todarodis TaxID=1631240 RepID=A0ABU3VDD3_9RHOB|nr:hypothetical protein [Sedimentitalea todarodis]MDU9004045.1 hypothetical protein [Sedimentitalea todarodis]
MDQIVFFGGFVGAFAIFDGLCDKVARAKLSEFLFGFHNVNAAKVERQIIVSLISGFLDSSGKLSFPRVLLWSLFASPICIFLGDVLPVFNYLPKQVQESANAIFSNYLHLPITFATISASVALASLPFDYWSLWIAKKIYLDRNNESGIYPFIKDLAASILPIIPLVLIVKSEVFSSLGLPLVVFTLENVSHAAAELLLHLVIYVPIGVVSSVFLSFLVRVSGFGAAMLIRFALRVTKVNQRLVLVSRLHEFPFTFIGVVSFLSYMVLGLLA